MNRDILRLFQDDDKSAPMVAGPGWNPSDAIDPGTAGNEPVRAFLVPWLNARGKIQMIQAYLC